MFNIDFNKFLLQLLPSFMRKSLTVAWLQSLIYPAKELYAKLKAYRDEKLYELNHNGQVYSIENVLNDRFDNVERRIYITDGLTKDRIFLFKRIEDKPMFLPKFLWNRGDYVDTGIDFIVWLPNAVVITIEEMYELRAMVDIYRINPKRYKVYRI